MMTVYGKAITQEIMDAIAVHMNDDIREQVHFDLAPCSPEEFLTAYLEKDPDFEEILKSEFGWEEEDEAVTYTVVVMDRNATNRKHYTFPDLGSAMEKARELWLDEVETKYTTVCVCESDKTDPYDLDDGDIIWEDGMSTR